ncbi:unnamed protein product [Heterobilharzia americana]|nr:unnamed protein product [Heterobilharzia americana]
MLRIIIEQRIEWQSTQLYLNFIDFEKAFDSINRKVIWQAVAATLLNTTNLYQPHSTAIWRCHIPSDSQWEKLSGAFEVKTGDRSKTRLSPIITHDHPDCG